MRLKPVPGRFERAGVYAKSPMKAYRTHKFSSPPVLSLDEVEARAPGDGEVLVGVRAAGLHLADFATLAGERSPRPTPPFAPGMEAAGFVLAFGADIDGLRPGDRVVTFQTCGGLAERIVVDAKACIRIPDGLTDGLAAALPFAYAGALIAVRGKARLEAGETLLVLGAGSQSGLAAIEIGKAIGAKVIASASGETRGDAANALGAEKVIDPSLTPLAEQVSKLTEGEGADVIFDPVGGDATQAAVAAGAYGARILIAGFAGGRTTNLNIQQFFERDMRLIAANMPATIANSPEIVRAAVEAVLEWRSQGKLHPRIAAQFPLSQADHALDYVRARRGSGAVIVTMGG